MLKRPTILRFVYLLKSFNCYTLVSKENVLSPFCHPEPREGSQAPERLAGDASLCSA